MLPVLALPGDRDVGGGDTFSIVSSGVLLAGRPRTAMSR